MAREKDLRLECHVKFNGRNPRHVRSALALASVNNRYKSSFIALAIEHYMEAHPLGIDLEELLNMYRQSERSYRPKAPISENLKNAHGQRRVAAPSDERPSEDAGTSDAINKAMDFYEIS